jgi:hypothetical protein
MAGGLHPSFTLLDTPRLTSMDISLTFFHPSKVAVFLDVTATENMGADTMTLWIGENQEKKNSDSLKVDPMIRQTLNG